VGCLYCGKEIGTIRQVHDTEFCSSAHRKSYTARLSKVLAQIAIPDPAPAGVATFVSAVHPHAGTGASTFAIWEFGRRVHEIHLHRSFPVLLDPILGQSFKPHVCRGSAPGAPDACAPRVAGAAPFRGVRLPRFTLDAASSMPGAQDLAAEFPEVVSAAPLEARQTDCGTLPATLAGRFPQSPPLCQPAAISTHTALAPKPAGAAAAPGAEFAEAFLPAAPEPVAMAFAVRAAALPALTISASTLELAGTAAAPAAELVESLLPAAPEPVAMAFAVRAAVLPALTLSAGTSSSEQPATLTLEPEPAVAFAGLIGAAGDRAGIQPGIPPLAAAPSTTYTPELAFRASVQPGPAAAFAELVTPSASPALPAVSLASAPPALAAVEPGFAGSRPAPRLDAAGPAIAPAAEIAEAFLPPLPEPVAMAFAAAAPLVPELALIAGDPEVLVPAPEILVIAPASEDWLPSAPACEAAREVQPFAAAAQFTVAALQLPSVAQFALAEPSLREEAGLLEALSPDPVAAYVSPRAAEAIPRSSGQPAEEVSTRATASLRPLTDSRFAEPSPWSTRTLAGPVAVFAPAAQGPAPSPVESELRPSFRDSLIAVEGQVRLPAWTLGQTIGRSAGEFQSTGPAAAVPAAKGPNARPERLEAACNISPLTPPRADAPCGTMPQPDLIPLEYFCQRGSMGPARRLEWQSRSIAPAPPIFNVRPVFERLEEVIPSRLPRKTPGFAEIFTLPGGRGRRPSKATLSIAARLLAASLLIGVAMWFGAGSAKIGREMLAVNTDLTPLAAPSGVDTSVYSARGVAPSGSASPASPASSPRPGVLARVRGAIQQRAAMEYSDSFKRMEAWGATPKSLPAGWARHADGYVTTGQMALYGPSLNFSDYRLEFLGEIEKKGMSWAVRAHDSRNYYAMKFKVIEPGLRPVIAMVHYPVVSGKPGHRIETPLDVMVHNLTAYHVAVEVKGNRIVTSIDGQEVDSFTDDSLKVGGVGFFADVDETARLYWMKVTRNQDWLGRVCAYFAGGSTTTITGELREPGSTVPDSGPSGPGAPSWPAPRHSAPPRDILLAANSVTVSSGYRRVSRSPMLLVARARLKPESPGARQARETSFASPPGGGIFRNGRTEPCSS